MEPALADSPDIVTFEGSPRNEVIYAIHQFNMKQRPPQIHSHMLLNPLEGKVLIDWDTKMCQLQFYGRTDRDPRNPAFSLQPFVRVKILRIIQHLVLVPIDHHPMLTENPQAILDED
jgi:hypothetical protein